MLRKHIPTGSCRCHRLQISPIPYDPDRALELLAQAGYYPADEITIYSGQGRIFRAVAFWAAVVEMWNEVGVNASLQLMDSDQHREVRRSGCGQFEDPLTCASQPSVPSPFSQSSGYYEWGTSNESLDLQRQLLLRNNCGSVNSRICDLVPGFEAALQHTVKTPLDSERTTKVSHTTKT